MCWLCSFSAAWGLCFRITAGTVTVERLSWHASEMNASDRIEGCGAGSEGDACSRARCSARDSSHVPLSLRPWLLSERGPEQCRVAGCTGVRHLTHGSG
jgi:hypothetical protein